MSQTKSSIVIETEKFMADPSRTIFDDALCTLLKCPSRDDPYAQFLPEVKDISESDLTDLRKCLPEVFSKVRPSWENPDAMSSLLTGLRLYDCWRECLLTEDGAYNLACAVINYLGDYDHDVGLDIFAADKVVDILNGWVKPQTPWPEPPDIGELCMSLFESTWCLLALPEKCMTHIVGFGGTSGSIAADLVRRDRPAFRKGLCHAQEIAAAATISLPENILGAGP